MSKMINPKITFYINYEKDLNYVLKRVKRYDPAGLEYRFKSKGLDPEVIRRTIEAKDPEDQKSIFDPYLQRYYSKNQTAMEQTKQKYQDFWDQHVNTFFDLVNEVMDGFTWNWDEYWFLVSAFYSKASWGKNNSLGVNWQREPEDNFYLNGYELVLTHHFEIVDQTYDKRPVSDWHLWALAETSAHLVVLGTQEMVNRLWPDKDQFLKNPETGFENGSYPQLAKPYREILPIFTNRKNYAEYVKKSIDIIGRYTEPELKENPRN